MNKKEIENKVRSAYDGVAPDVLSSVLSECGEQKGAIVIMEKKKNNTWWKKAIAAAAALLLCLSGLLGITNYLSKQSVASTVMLDVNPSIEIKVNSEEKVLSVVPLNSDAEIVVGEMDFTGSSLEVAVNALIGSMLRNGYITETANSILVSVDSADTESGKALQHRLMEEINAILSGSNISGAILGQTLDNDDELSLLASSYGITLGKAKLIRQITLQNNFYTFEELVPLTINELNLISESGSLKLEDIESTGQASSSAYIGEAAAKSAAFAHAGVLESDIYNLEWELDWEDGKMVYEIEFNCGEYEYEYDIDALTGSVLKSEKEYDNDHRASHSSQNSSAQDQNSSSSSQNSQSSASSGSYIGETAARSIALEHAGVKESDVYKLECELDREDGKMIYEVEFDCGGYEYEYDIDALTGDVLKYSKEFD